MSQGLSYDQLKERYKELPKNFELLTNELKLKEEEVRFLKDKLFGRSKETVKLDDDQLSLFDGVPDINEINEIPDEETIIYTRKRKKQKGKKRKILEQFQEVPIIHELEDTHCQACHQDMIDIGQTKVREELVFIPATMERHVHYAKSYKCTACSENSDHDCIVKAKVPQAPIQNSLGSASIIAETIDQKYNLKVPGYRQEKKWKEVGLPITRQQINQWHITCAQYYFSYVWEALAQELLRQDILHADETTYRVIESQKETNYYWLFQSGRHQDRQVVLYIHSESRKYEVAQTFLADFEGYLHSDMYGAYLNLPDSITIVGCLAHVRRKFYECLPKKDPPKDSVAYKAVALCNRAFKLEEAWIDLTADERFQLRQEKLKPVLEAFFELVESYGLIEATGKLAKAIDYALKYKDYFMNVLEDGRLELSNNLAERSIKELVIGRKNWLFSASLAGAQASGIILSLKVTAESHGLAPAAYFKLLLEELPTLYHENRLMENIQAYLPWSDYVQSKLTS